MAGLFKDALRWGVFLFLLLSISQRSFPQRVRYALSTREELFRTYSEFIESPAISLPRCDIPSNLPIEELFKTALLYNSTGNRQCCYTMLQSVLDKQTKFTPIQLCHYHLAWAQYYTLHQTYDSAYFYSSLANKAATERNWKDEKAEALLLLSAGGLRKRNISFAYACADSALIIARQTGNNNLEGRILLQLALTVRRHFTAIAHRSLPYYFAARDKALATLDFVNLATIDLYLASDYFELKQWGEGISYFKEGIGISLRNKNFALRYIAYICFGYAFELTTNYNEALSLFLKALHLSQQQQNSYDIQHCYQDISICYQGMRQYDSALVYASLAGNVAGIDSFWANVWDLKASIYDNIGNYKLATGMYKKSIDWFREDFFYRNQDQLSGYEARLNTKEKELQVAQQKKRTIQLEWLIGGGAILLLISAIAFALQRKAKHTLFVQNNLIQKQRSLLEQSLGEKEILLKEIHHRVKNNLSIISSLLELQSSGISNEAAKAAIATGQNRVSSIALIHQRLYQHENLAAIELGGFVEDLLRQVGSVFNKPGTTIQTEILIPETLLDIDTAVPLGLIMNELITNSYKYAFNDHKQGVIKINLQQQNPGEYLLVYADNGPGISKEIDIKNITSLGLRLIQRLSKQLGGSTTYEYRNGSTFKIDFKDSNTRNRDE